MRVSHRRAAEAPSFRSLVSASAAPLGRGTIVPLSFIIRATSRLVLLRRPGRRPTAGPSLYLGRLYLRAAVAISLRLPLSGRPPPALRKASLRRSRFGV